MAAAAGEFPTGATNGNIKFGAVGSTLYAAITNSSSNDLLDIQKSSDGGLTWASAAGSIIGTTYSGRQGGLCVHARDRSHE